jgi:hypothetical protein
VERIECVEEKADLGKVVLDCFIYILNIKKFMENLWKILLEFLFGSFSMDPNFFIAEKWHKQTSNWLSGYFFGALMRTNGDFFVVLRVSFASMS